MLKKEGKKIEIASEKYIKWLSELSKNDTPIVGGKGANLAEMYNARFPVPPAFCITAQSFDIFLQKAGIKDKIKQIISKTNVFNTSELEKNSKEIRDIIADSEIPEDMTEEILEAYELLSNEAKNEKEIIEKSDKKTKDKSEKVEKNENYVFVAVRSSATTEDLAAASFAGQQETFTNIRGKKQLLEAVKKCFASLYTARAVYYRHKQGFDKANALLSVVVQRMINSDKSGVMFTKNPSTAKDEIIIESVFGLGEGIVSGKILPDHYVVNPDLEIIEQKIANKKIKLVKEENGNGIEVKLDKDESNSQVLTVMEITSLANYGQKIEKHYGRPQDIEFAIEKNKIFIVQSRPITTLEKARDHNEKNKDKTLSGNILLSGLAASPGVASGTVKIIKDMKDLGKVKKGDVLVTKMTNPDMVISMQKSVAVVTDEGGATSHAAIVSREMGIPCVVGTEKATELLKDGQIITVDGVNGRVFDGKIIASSEQSKKEILPIVKTRTKIKVMVDLPDFAGRAAKTQAEAVGLVRLEGIIAEGGKHPLMFLKENNTKEYSRLIEHGIKKIAEHFKEIWIRTSDIRSDEYRNLLGAPKEVEVNPMLGFHGIRFSLKNPELFEAEFEAIRKVAEHFPNKKFGIMFPQVINEQELVEAFKMFHDKYERDNIILGAMIETPAAVQIIRSICKYVKFISFGTNDLTQYTLAVDRGNSECQYLYDEMHPAVLSQLKRVIDICKEYKVESSICGQAGSKKEMVEQLVKYGIDSLSVNADVAGEISQFVAELEKSINEKGFKSSKQGNDMAKANNKSKILPIDDTQEVEEKIVEKKKEVEKGKKKEEAQEAKPTSTSEEFPEFEIGFDPFQQQ
jgi:pyruvate,water dikinase